MHAEEVHHQLIGLEESTAKILLLQDGLNEHESHQKKSLIQRIWGMCHEPMFVLLLSAALIYLALGDLGEGITLSTFVLAVLGLTFYQEGKSESSIDALRELNQYSATVIRSGKRIKIPSKNIVKGDLVVVSEGDRIPADGVLIQAQNMEVDESLLTGESIPLEKSSDSSNKENIAQLFSGTYIIRGHGIFRVTATGMNTEIGKIGSSINALIPEETPLHKQTRHLVKIISLIGLVLCTGMVLALGFRNGQWLAAVLSGIALAMAMLPEEYPVVLAIFPALGAHRLAKQGVLTRHLNSIETLGATTVLCTDKTGTLTENKMSVQTLVVSSNLKEQLDIYKCIQSSNESDLPRKFHKLIEYSVLASAENPYDPMEIAFHHFSNKFLTGSTSPHSNLKLIKSYPLSVNLKAVSQVWFRNDLKVNLISAKGAPEAVMDLCHFDLEKQSYWKAAMDDLANQGLRVLAVAEGNYIGEELPQSVHDINFQWIGLIGLADPIRAEVPAAMQVCQSAGIRVVMITGDYATTALAIAKQAGMPSGKVITSKEIDSLTDRELQVSIKDAVVCARISPQQKLRIVQALKQNGEIVAMTGDGVNDAPALRAAHVGIAMGSRGTDVAREASDMVLVDDNFASIVKGIRTGRQIFSNLQRSMAYIFAIHIPIAMLALIPMLFLLPALFLPLHIALIEMIIDPACSLAFENEPENSSCMINPPRNTASPLFGMTNMLNAFWQGLLVFLSALAALFASNGLDLEIHTNEQTRSMVMIAFVIANGFLIHISLSENKSVLRKKAPRNWAALYISIGTVFLILMCVYVPWLSNKLSFIPLDLTSLTIAVACGCLGICFNQIYRLVRWR